MANTTAQTNTLPQQNIALQAGKTTEILVAAGQNVVTSSTIDGAVQNADGSLSVKFANGATLIIKNFAETIAQGPAPTLTTANGQKVDLTTLVAAPATTKQAANQAGEDFMPTLTDGTPVAETKAQKTAEGETINAPKAGQDVVVTLEAGEVYNFGFAMNEPVSVKNDGQQLVITFKNGGEIIIPNFGAFKNSANAPQITMKDGAKLAASDFADMLATATQLNQTEPAAGDAGGGAGRGGFGFQSAFGSTPFQSLDAIGPINPTQLRYDVTDNRPQPILDQPVAPVANLTVSDSQVYEDNSVALNVASTPASPTQQVTITISGILPGWTVDTSVSGGTYDPATGTWTLTAPVGQAITTGPIVTPPANSDADMPNLSVNLSVTDTANGLTSTLTGTINVVTDAVIDAPSINIADNGSDEIIGTEDVDTPLNITVSRGGDTLDNSEVLSNVTIAGVPAGFTLSAGKFDAGTGLWTLTQAELVGLTMKAPANYSDTTGNIVLTVSVTDTETNLSGSEFDLNNNTATATDTVIVKIKPVVDEPDLAVTLNPQGGVIDEDTSATMTIQSALKDTDGSEQLTITVSGINTSWDVVAPAGFVDMGGGVWKNTLPLGVTSFTGNFEFTPPDNSDADMTGILVTATATEQANGATASKSQTVDIIVDAVIDIPTLIAPDTITAAEDTSFDLNLDITRGDDILDGSEVLTITISGVPAGATLSAGTNLGGGVWSLTLNQVAGLKLTPAKNYNGTFNLTVTVTDTETNLSGLEPDLSDNTKTLTDIIAITVTPQADDPALVVSDKQTKEDTGVQLPVTATLAADSAASDYMVITISGILPGWTVNTATSGGTYNAATGTWTRTVAAGQNYTGGPTFTPPADSDADMTGLVVTVTQYDAANTVLGSATGNASIIVDAVIDAPTLNVSNANGEEDLPIALNISVSKGGDTADGSEVLSNVTISGMPAGATLSAGTNLGGGVWSLTPAQLVGLKLTPATGYDGTFNLTVSVTDTETNLSGVEFDLTDNTATVTKTLTVNVTPDDVPTIIKPADKVVDETNLTPGPVGVTGTISANFFSDGPGVVAGNGSFAFGGSAKGGQLTSNGVPVVVTLVGDTYVGTAGGNQIFTLKVLANGAYDFKLTGVLDHADVSNPNDAINLNFGVKATDTDGDIATTTITIKVLDDAPIANDDHNDFNTADRGASGNVISGLNGGAGAADAPSEDNLANNTVTKIAFGSTVVEVPAVGTATIQGTHGKLTIAANGTYTYVLDAGAGGGAPGTTVDVPRIFTGNTFTASLDESVPITDPGLLGQLHTNMTIAPDTTITGQITFEGAGYNNSLGLFTIAADGTLQSASMVASSLTGPGANFSVGQTAGATQLGFFLVADGFNTNNQYAGLNFATGELNFVYKYGTVDARDAKISDNGADVKLVFTDAGGVDHVIQGPIYFTSDRGGSNSLNPDGLVHTISGVSATDSNTLTIGFEDLPNGGDQDYNDIVFNVQITDHVTTPADVTDQFVYTLTDGDGDSDTAILYLNGAGPDMPVLIVGDAQVKEDGQTQLQVNASLTDASEHLTVSIKGFTAGWTVDTTASGGTYNAATGTWTITLPTGVNFSGGPIVKPPTDTDVDLTGLIVTATSTDAAGNSVGTTGTMKVVVDAVIDAPTLNVSNASGEEDTAIALNISATKGGDSTDGSEVLSNITISGVPAGATLSAGTNLGGGVWSLTSAQLINLKLNPPAGFDGTFNLTVSVTDTETNLSGIEFDLTDNTATVTKTLTVNVTSDDVPTIVKPADKTVDETNLTPGPVGVTGAISANFFSDGPGVIAANGSFAFGGSAKGGQLTSNGVTVVVTLVGDTYVGAAGGNQIFTLKVSANGAYDFKLTGVLDHADAANPNDAINLTFGVRATDNDGDTVSTTLTVKVLDDGVTANDDFNTKFVADVASGNVVTGLNGGANAKDDLSEDVSNVVSRVLFGAKIVDVPSTGFATIDGEYGTLKIFADGSYTYTLFAGVAALGDIHDEFIYVLRDGDGDTDNALLVFDVPKASTPTLTVNDEMIKEDSQGQLDVTATLTDPTEQLTVTISGFTAGWTVDTTTSGGTYNAATGTWTITMAVGQNFSGGPIVRPPANSDADLNGLVVIATSRTSTGATASSNASLNVIVDAVIDAPTLNVSNATGEEDQAIALNISAGRGGDTADGSEVLSNITISGVPAGATLSAGTNLGGGVWSLTSAQLVNLKLNPPAGFDGTFNLTVSVTDTETNLSGLEYDLTDNSATVTKTLTVNVTPDDLPTIAKPGDKDVDETDLKTGPDTVSGTVTANFFTDGPGTFSATGAGTFGFGGSVKNGALTSNGVPVVISLVGNKYVGTASGKEIFTLQINSNGSYTFILKDQLDHANVTDPNDVMTLNFGITATDKDGDTAATTIGIRVFDDGPKAFNDTGNIVIAENGTGSATGNVITGLNGGAGAADSLSQDDPNAITQIGFNGNIVNIPSGSFGTIAGNFGTLKIFADGSYTYTLDPAKTSSGQSTDSFTYTLIDADGDTSTATLTLNGLGSTFKVGENVNDTTGSTTPYEVGTGTGIITGRAGNDILVGDVGGTRQVVGNKDYNIVMVLDISGSMGLKTDPASKYSLLMNAVKNLMQDFSNYEGGEVRIHIVPFSTSVFPMGTFDVSTTAGYNAAIAYINNMSAGGGFTNYEAGMQAAIAWLQGQNVAYGKPITGAETYSYFISDGEPNRFVNDATNTVVTGTEAQSMGQISGTDGTNEIAILKSLSTEVIGVGIDITNKIANIAMIDSDGNALNINDPNDLTKALASASPIAQFNGVGADTIVAGDGNDMIFGDSLYTDTLATAKGIALPAGSGWEVFAKLEAGLSAISPNWTRADTLDYIRNNASSLARESVNGSNTRSGGNDRLEGGLGDDIIFGQEGDDLIIGGMGNDVLSGGSGMDTFRVNALNEGVDQIVDFKVSQGDILDISNIIAGYDPLTDSLADFVKVINSGGNSIVQVDATGTGTAYQTVVVLQGVTVDLDTLSQSGNLIA